MLRGCQCFGWGGFDAGVLAGWVLAGCTVGEPVGDEVAELFD
jgi:hypothetical protein